MEERGEESDTGNKSNAFDCIAVHSFSLIEPTTLSFQSSLYTYIYFVFCIHSHIKLMYFHPDNLRRCLA